MRRIRCQQQAQEIDNFVRIPDVLPGQCWRFVNSFRLSSMDSLDHQLLGLLRENARTPVATLATQLRVSRGTVQNRIDRLVADGVLLGFTVRCDMPPLRASTGPSRKP
jgi:hypothetical protein